MNPFSLRHFLRLALGLAAAVTASSCTSGDEFGDASKSAPYALLVATGAQDYFQRGPTITHINGLPASTSTSRNYYRLATVPTTLQLKAGMNDFTYPPINFTPVAGRKYDVGYESARRYAVLFDITDSESSRVVTRSAGKPIQ